MPKDQSAARGGGGTKNRGQGASDFAGVKRRNVPKRDVSMAANLVAAAEEVADAGFLGTAPDSANALQPHPAPSRDQPQPAPPPADAAQETSPGPPRADIARPGPSLHVHEESLPASSRVVIPRAGQPVGSDQNTGAETLLGPEAALDASEADGEQDVGLGTLEPATTEPVPDPDGRRQGQERKVARGTVTEKPRRPPRSTPKQGPTLRDLHSAFADSRTNSRQWQTHGANLVPEVWNALRTRIAQDRRSANNPELAAGHYMDVVFRNAPLDAHELIDLFQQLSDRRMGYLGSGKKSTFRIGPVARRQAGEIKAILDEADYARKGLYVVSALVVQLLRRLEQEGPLLRPDLPPLV